MLAAMKASISTRCGWLRCGWLGVTLLGWPGLVQARYFVALEKAPHEALEPLAPLAAVQLAMSQCFDVAEVALPRVEVRRRLLAYLAEATAHVEAMAGPAQA